MPTHFSITSRAPEDTNPQESVRRDSWRPIRKNKAFFFADYQGEQIHSPSPGTLTVPTAAQRNDIVTGNFSTFGTAIYNPNSLVTGSGGTQVRAAYPGNVIPATSLILWHPSSSSGTLASKRGVYQQLHLQPHGDHLSESVRYTQEITTCSRRIGFSSSSARMIQVGPLSRAAFPRFRNPACPVGPYIDGGGQDVTFRNWSATATTISNSAPT